MGYINIFLSSPCKVTIKNKQLTIQGEGRETIPLEDVNSLMIETQECNITSYALQSLAKENVAVFVCDKSHTPNGIILPFGSYYRQLKVIKEQLKVSKPLHKQLWQSIIKQKICNQAEVCRLANIPSNLLELHKQVNSGDTANIEAVAANIYFKLLFGRDFGRQKECGINACLNYGYAIVRGLIARTLVAHGFLPCLGIHHINEFNNFNLADDIIEPYRPIVDLIVYNNLDSIETTLTTQMKRNLFGIVNNDVLINGQVHSVSYAVELTVQSLLACYSNTEQKLLLPKILPINQHSYE